MKVRLWQEPNLLDPDGDLDALRRLLDAGIPSRHDWIEIYDELYHTWKLVTYVFYCRILLRPNALTAKHYAIHPIHPDDHTMMAAQREAKAALLRRAESGSERTPPRLRTSPRVKVDYDTLRLTESDSWLLASMGIERDHRKFRRRHIGYRCTPLCGGADPGQSSKNFSNPQGSHTKKG